MSATAASIQGEIEIFRQSASTTRNIVHKNLDSITHEESLTQPRPAGNCINWVLGHLLCVYNDILPLVGEKNTTSKDTLKPYARGSSPLASSSEVMPLSELLAAFDEASDRFESGLSKLVPEVLDGPAPASPRNNPNETVRSLLALVSFHQAYHAGQLGILRRLAGKKGAIA